MDQSKAKVSTTLTNTKGSSSTKNKNKSSTLTNMKMTISLGASTSKCHIMPPPLKRQVSSWKTRMMTANREDEVHQKKGEKASCSSRSGSGSSGSSSEGHQQQSELVSFELTNGKDPIFIVFLVMGIYFTHGQQFHKNLLLVKVQFGWERVYKINFPRMPAYAGESRSMPE